MNEWLPPVVQALQFISLVAWGFCAYLRLPDVRKAMRDARTLGEDLGGVGFYFGLLQVDFIVRWFLWPSAIGTMDGWQLADWASCYAFSVVLAVHYARLILKGRE